MQATAAAGSSASRASSSSEASSASSATGEGPAPPRINAANARRLSIVACRDAYASTSAIAWASRSPESRSTRSQRRQRVLTPSAETESPPRKSGSASAGRAWVAMIASPSASAPSPSCSHCWWRSSRRRADASSISLAYMSYANSRHEELTRHRCVDRTRSRLFRRRERPPTARLASGKWVIASHRPTSMRTSTGSAPSTGSSGTTAAGEAPPFVAGRPGGARRTSGSRRPRAR